MLVMLVSSLSKGGGGSNRVWWTRGLVEASPPHSELSHQRMQMVAVTHTISTASAPLRAQPPQPLWQVAMFHLACGHMVWWSVSAPL